jgi:hypothetical protein
MVVNGGSFQDSWFFIRAQVDLDMNSDHLDSRWWRNSWLVFFWLLHVQIRLGFSILRSRTGDGNLKDRVLDLRSFVDDNLS